MSGCPQLTEKVDFRQCSEVSAEKSGLGDRQKAQIAQGAKTLPVAEAQGTRAGLAVWSELRSVAGEYGVNECLAAQDKAVGKVSHAASERFLQRQAAVRLDNCLNLFGRESLPHRAAFRIAPFLLAPHVEMPAIRPLNIAP